MRSARAALCLVLALSMSSVAQELTESTDYPNNLPGPVAAHPNGGCFFLASGTIEPGDVDWVGVSVPFASDETVVDVDIASGTGGTLLLVMQEGGSTYFAMSDGNNANDNLCGLGSGSDPVGSTSDSVVAMGATDAGAMIEIAVTGSGDFGFVGAHSQSFSYEVWVYANAPTAGCMSDADCDDGVACTVDTCNLDTGECSNAPDDSACDNGLFCDGEETCDAAQGCRAGDPPCDEGMDCDEDTGACFAAAPPAALDMTPGVCRSWLNARSNAVIKVALLGSDAFPVEDVDLDTLVLSRADGLGEPVAPLARTGGDHPRDLGRPVFTERPCDCVERRLDGVPDLLLRFRARDLGKAFGLTNVRRTTTVEVTLSGTTLDGTPFALTDCVHVVALKRPRRAGL